MSELLVALASCHDAFVAAPVIVALQQRRKDVRIAWFGSVAEFEQARRLGVPETSVCHPPAAGEDSDLVRMARLAALATEHCAAVVTIGNARLSTCIGQAARERGVPVIRIATGDRTAGGGDRDRRLADHAADSWCVSGEWQRNQLLQEGMSAMQVHVTGSLLAHALARLPQPAPAPPHLWLAIEHAHTVAAAPRLAALLDEVTAAARTVDLPVHAVASVLAPALRQLGVTPPRDLVVATDADAVAQLDAARNAALIVTDSAGYQELAAAAGIACVVLPDAAARPDLLASGAVQLADRATAGMLAAVQRARRPAGRQPTPVTGNDHPASRVADVIDRLLAAVPERSDQPVARLPSDGDASGRTLGDAEIALVTAALRSGTLNSTRGTFVSRFEREFADWLGCKHAVASANGSAAVHAAIAALALSAGDEVITTPITDMGALTPIFYEGAVPVFADVDATTLNVTAGTIEAQLTERTRAIVVTHLFGRSCDMTAIVALARQHSLPLIEDTAQAFGATWQGRKAGTFGELAAFSLQQGKHITTGEGGIVCTDDDELARRLFLFVNKAWGYGDAKPDHYFPALNYRLSELQGAVACAQLPKLDHVVARRRTVAAQLRQQLAEVAGIACPDDPPAGMHSYWKFAFRVDAEVLPGGAVALGTRMREAGIACAPRYVQKPAFECAVFRDWRNSPVSRLPLQQNARGRSDGPLFDRADYPGAIAGLEQVVVLPINERYTEAHVGDVGEAIRRASKELADG